MILETLTTPVEAPINPIAGEGESQFHRMSLGITNETYTRGPNSSKSGSKEGELKHIKS